MPFPPAESRNISAILRASSHCSGGDFVSLRILVCYCHASIAREEPKYLRGSNIHDIRSGSPSAVSTTALSSFRG
jgi:hypothetical protein